jgi:hypothetical protein
MFKFAPDEFVEPTSNGLKIRNDVIKRLTIQLLTGASVATYARLCTNRAQLIHAKFTHSAGLMLKTTAFFFNLNNKSIEKALPLPWVIFQ